MITILDQQNADMIVAEKDVSEQTLYSLDIPANTLNPGGKIRITAELHIAVATPPECEVCIPSVNPGEQPLTEIFLYNFENGIPVGSLGSNLTSQMNFVGWLGDHEEMIATAGDRSGFHTSYAHLHTIVGPSGDHWELIRLIGHNMEAVNPTDLPIDHVFTFPSQDAQAGAHGHSDEHGYLIDMTQSNPVFTGLDVIAYFNYEANTVTYMQKDPTALFVDIWTKYGDQIFGFDFADTSKIITHQVSNLSVGVVTNFAFNWQDLHASESFLWGLRSNNKIVQLTKTNLSILDTITYDITPATTSVSFWVINDVAAYILTANSKIYHLNFNTGETTFISNISGTTTQGTLHFRRGYFYIFNIAGRIAKYGPLNCPGTEELLGA